MPQQHLTAKKLFSWAAVAAVLAAVFMAYTRPEFMLELANQVWLCF